GYTQLVSIIQVMLRPVDMGSKHLRDPMKVRRAVLASDRSNYNRNPLLLWSLTNMAVAVDTNENIRPVKTADRRRRIDPAVALIIAYTVRSEEHTSELQSRENLVCRLLLENKDCRITQDHKLTT